MPNPLIIKKIKYLLGAVIVLLLLLGVSYYFLVSLPKQQKCENLQIDDIVDNSNDDSEIIYNNLEKLKQRVDQIIRTTEEETDRTIDYPENAKKIKTDITMARQELADSSLSNSDPDEAFLDAYQALRYAWIASYELEVMDLGECVNETTKLLDNYSDSCYLPSYDPLKSFTQQNGSFFSQVQYLEYLKQDRGIDNLSNIQHDINYALSQRSSLFSLNMNCPQTYKELKDSLEYQEPYCERVYVLTTIIKWNGVIIAFLLGILLQILLTPKNKEKTTRKDQSEKFSEIIWEYTCLEKLITALLFSIIIFYILYPNVILAIGSSLLSFLLVSFGNFWSLFTELIKFINPPEKIKQENKDDSQGYQFNAEKQYFITNVNVSETITAGTAMVKETEEIKRTQVSKLDLEAITTAYENYAKGMNYG